jgi:glutathione S-transferase
MKPEITLYGVRISPFVEKVLRTLELKKLPYQLQASVSPGLLEQVGPNPKKVPVVRIGDAWVYDSTFILRELDRIEPAPPLFSAEPVAAAAQRRLEDWADEALYFCVYAIRWSDEHAAETRDELARLLRPKGPRPEFDTVITALLRERPRVQGMGLLPYDVLLRETAFRLDDLVLTLGDRPFFHGDQPGAADMAIYGQLSTSLSDATPDLAALVTERAPLTEFMARVEALTGGGANRADG